MSLIFATGNAKKIKEAIQLLGREIIPAPLELLQSTPPENGTSFEENALIKARFIFEKTGQACFAEDSGLCVDALNGAPGIFSARFAGASATDASNNIVLLEKMEHQVNRAAHYTAVICYIGKNGQAHFFEGKVYGSIAAKPAGNTGFGYDPLFIPKGMDKTFAELGSEVKNKISHRKNAMEKFYDFLVRESIV